MSAEPARLLCTNTGFDGGSPEPVTLGKSGGYARTAEPRGVKLEPYPNRLSPRCGHYHHVPREPLRLAFRLLRSTPSVPYIEVSQQLPLAKVKPPF